MPLIAVILPYAVTIRDFVHTGALDELRRIPGTRVHIYTQNPNLPEFDSLRRQAGVELLPLPAYEPGRVEAFLRHLYPLLFFDTFVYLQKALEGRRGRIRIASMIAGLRRLLGSGRTVRIAGKLLLMTGERGGANYLKDTPDVVVGTRSLVASLDFPVIREAVRRKLPLVTAASSWDNFTTKGFLPFPVEKTIVWNQKMADELVEIFEVPRDEIVIAGYPRVRLLADTGPFGSPAEYLAALGLDKYRRFVLYSASYGELTRTNPAEPPREFQLIREVATKLGPQLPDDTCILVRLHPYSLAVDETFFDGIERVHLFVPGRGDQYLERVMSVEDEWHLAAQLQHCECVISMASTMTIDALSLGRPVLNVAFEPNGEGNAICRFYEYNHFADLLRIVKPPLARSAAEVIQFVQKCQSGDQNPDIDKDAFEEFYVPTNSADYPLVLRRTLEDVANQARASNR